ncbi:hypothetical protein DER44DRAFT_857116 [Fusarium oxysporum]|nr:hypothetical protein DER44DRAFT_857116 [Fusarium oxysporum]
MTQTEVQVFGVKLSDRNIFPDRMYNLISGYHQQWHSTAGRLELLDVLYQFRILDCTVAHDRIYGFLGIVHPDAAAKISPDYHLDVPQVYRDFARTMIQVTNNLHVLNCTRQWSGVDNGTQQQKAYSVLEQSRYYDIHALIFDGPDKTPRRGWARLPDGWERIPSKEKSLFRDNGDRTKQSSKWSPLEGQQAVRAEHYIKQRELSLGWSKIWEILAVQEWCMALGRRRENTNYEMKKSFFGRSYPGCPPGLLTGSVQVDGTLSRWQLGPAWHPQTERSPISRRGINDLVQWKTLGLIELPDCPYSGAGGRTNALWRTMIADFAGADAADSDDWPYIETWYDRTGWGRELPDMASRGIYETTTLEGEITDLQLVMHTQFLQIRPLPNVGTRELLKQPWMDFSHNKKKYGGYIKRIYDACAHRSLFITYRGYMGLAPWNAQIGDKVAILRGGETPFILRNVKGTEDFSLVGEAFVYGLMAGEGMMDFAGKARDINIL